MDDPGMANDFFGDLWTIPDPVAPPIFFNGLVLPNFSYTLMVNING